MDTMTLIRMRAAQSSRAGSHNLMRANLQHPVPTPPQPAVRRPVQPTPQPDPALAQLVDLGLRTLVPVQYQIVKTGGAVLESPTVPGAVKFLAGVVVTAAVVSGGKEVGRVLDNLLS